MTRIDCLLNSFAPSQYGVLPDFTKQFHEGLLASGIDSRLWKFDLDNPTSFIQEVLKDPPLCTVSFNILSANDKSFLIPDSSIYHASILVDPIYYFLENLSHSSIATCVDRKDTEIYQRLGFSNLFFLPHGAHKIEEVIPFEKKKYEVVMLSSALDYEEARREWQEKYTPELNFIMNAAVELLLEDPKISSYQAFIDVLDSFPEKNIVLDNADFMFILYDLDFYVRGVDRVELIRSIKNARVDIFGSGNWGKYINQPNVFIHGGIPFTESLEVIKQSKVILNSCPTVKDGAHERSLTGIVAGALVVHSESQYMREEFPEGAVVFYDSKNIDSVNEAIDSFLENPSKNAVLREVSRQTVLKMHTWEQRVKQFVVELFPRLKNLKNTSCL